MNWYVYGRARNGDLTLVDIFSTADDAKHFCEQWGWFADDGERRWSLYIDVDVSLISGLCKGSTTWCEDWCSKHHKCDTIAIANDMLKKI